MADSRGTLTERAQAYAVMQGIALENQLGYGNDGTIWATGRKSAVKAFERESGFCRERDVYLRLLDNNVVAIQGLAVPQLIRFDDALWVIEMDVVNPPFLLDFAKAHLDAMPDFSPEVMADWESERSELFGDDWPQVQSVLRGLRRYGIFYFDAKPSNICLRADSTSE